MNTLYLLTPVNDINGYGLVILYLLFFVSILSGILVIISKNPIISVLYLISLFLSIACYLFILGLNFIALSYLLVYVGAVSILFLFILMLINIRVSELLDNTNNSIPLAIILAISFYYIMFVVLPFEILSADNYFFVVKLYLSNISFRFDISFLKQIFLFYTDNSVIVFVTSKTWDGGLSENIHITSLGNIMYTNYLMWLLITSMILLLAMVGAIVITIKQKD